MSRCYSGMSKTAATNIASFKVASCTPEIIARYFVVLKKAFCFGENRVLVKQCIRGIVMKLVSMVTKAMRKKLPEELQRVR